MAELQPPTHPGLLMILSSACSPRSIRSTLANHSLTHPKAINVIVLLVNEYLHLEQRHKASHYSLLPAVATFLACAILPPCMIWGPWHTTQVAAFQFSHFTVANRKNHASFRCTNQLSDARQTAAFPIEDNALLREDFFHQLGTRLLSDFLHFLVQKELSDCLKSESVI